jgi:hypothetical protein
MSFVYKFLFRNDKNEYIGEKKFIDMPEDTPKHLKFQWFIKNDENEKALSFISMEHNKREFKEGLLEIHNDYCIFNGIKYNNALE